MFSLFSQKKDESPISHVFSNLTTYQKMSVLNLLLTIGGCDGEQGNPEKERQYLNSYIKPFGVRSKNCLTYLDSAGFTKMISDLKSIHQDHIEFIIIAVWEMIIDYSGPN